jgi:hypothetical protein
MTIHICLVMVAMVIVIGRQKDRDDFFQGLVVAMVRRIDGGVEFSRIRLNSGVVNTPYG